MAKEPAVMDPVESAVRDEEPAVIAPLVVKFKLLATTFPT
jgi:hypothetical protein